MLQVHPINALNDNYIWCVVNPTTRKCVVIDPGDAQPVHNFLASNHLTLCAILITHHHHDHTQGIPGLIQKLNLPVFGPFENISGKNHSVAEGDLVKLAELDTEFRVFSIPGHTKGHVAYFGDNAVFCGDTLFTAGCGKIFEGTPEQMYQSLAKLSALPNNTLVYCGHEYTLNNLKFAQTVEPNNPAIAKRLIHTQTLRQKNIPTVPATMELEKQTNPFLRCDHPHVVKAANDYYGGVLNDPVKVFAVLREWKNVWSPPVV